MAAITSVQRDGVGVQLHRQWWLERPAYFEQETGPGLIFIEGGTYTMGQVDDDLNYAWDNIPRRVGFRPSTLKTR